MVGRVKRDQDVEGWNGRFAGQAKRITLLDQAATALGPGLTIMAAATMAATPIGRQRQPSAQGRRVLRLRRNRLRAA